MKITIAIDPGVAGGIAVTAFGRTFCQPMPATQGDLCEWIRDLQRTAEVEAAAPPASGGKVECVCVLEQVGGFVGKRQPGSAMFKFGEHFGFIKGVVQTLGLRLVLVRPQAWQKGFGLGTAASCASSREWKNKLKAEAQRRFPQLHVTLATADALLILEWALRAGHGADARTSQRDVPTTTISDAHGARTGANETEQPK